MGNTDQVSVTLENKQKCMSYLLGYKVRRVALVNSGFLKGLVAQVLIADEMEFMCYPVRPREKLIVFFVI